MIRLEDRQSMVQDIAVAQSAGARLLPACLIVGITPTMTPSPSVVLPAIPAWCPPMRDRWRYVRCRHTP